ncbi:adenosylcobinamide amidohydrolase [Pseudalkalibacillus berkeleyi]|uniref:Adenosylcobinamide amidohydrolase n=1 Tax=Pseudalkalibacillus berkeleyi TaxID=1069813 RepID=A0ABS9H1D7_9BACL|nr:adenosylcobinamide amidohydrolase [Pseudalkalibacillus berkeleyi]MCF6137470.1 adenosylcobinamide amidohydrolase [Pseudalkalibacillus berkeleyi]
MINVQNLTGGYGKLPIVSDLAFKVRKGELYGILGPNGSGKTTVLKMISGILPFEQGSVTIKGRLLESYSTKELAKIIAVLPQHASQSFSYTVKDTVSLGRYAHQSGWFQTWSEEDEEIVQRVMKQTGVDSFQKKDIQTLSGGEKQRVFLAQALAQEPEILLLDEPTNHLDLSYQKELLDVLKLWTRENGLTVISIFHDLNLAGLYCDQLLLLDKGKINIQHKPNEVLREERIQSVYKTKIKKQPHPNVPAPQMMLLPESNDNEGNTEVVQSSFMKILEDKIVLETVYPLKTLSSGVVGSGSGWHKVFINRRVGLDYECSNHREEMQNYLIQEGYEPSDCVGMMTAVHLEDASFQHLKDDELSIFVVVTAGVGHAIDASKSHQHNFDMQPGTINTWIFVNGNMTEEAFIQCMMTATEVKSKVLHDQNVKDPVTNSFATGTATDSILVAATQSGEDIEFAGTITPLGKLVGQAVYHCTTEAIGHYRRRVGKGH